MTICIAAICEANTGCPQIVFCADRLVTDKDGRTFETGLPKIVELTHNCLVMNAGDFSRGDLIIKDTLEILSSFTLFELQHMKIKEIVDIIKEQYIKRRNQAIEIDIFKPRNIDRNSFYSNLKAFPEWFAITVDKEVGNYNFGAAFIILGFDISEVQSGIPHIYELRDSGEPKIMDANGFSIVGSGYYQSLPEITGEPYSPSNSLGDAIVRTFGARKTAERMVSGGKETTDLGLMYLDYDKSVKDLVARNIVASEEFKSKLISEGFEKGKQAMKQLIQEVGKNMEVFIGKRTTWEK